MENSEERKKRGGEGWREGCLNTTTPSSDPWWSPKARRCRRRHCMRLCCNGWRLIIISLHVISHGDYRDTQRLWLCPSHAQSAGESCNAHTHKKSRRVGLLRSTRGDDSVCVCRCICQEATCALTQTHYYCLHCQDHTSAIFLTV